MTFSKLRGQAAALSGSVRGITGECDPLCGRLRRCVKQDAAAAACRRGPHVWLLPAVVQAKKLTLINPAFFAAGSHNTGTCCRASPCPSLCPWACFVATRAG